MFKTKRKRAVVLALIAFFCTAATTYVAVDWRRLGGGFLAYFRGNGAHTVASSGGGSAAGAGFGHASDLDGAPRSVATLPHVAAAGTRHRDRVIGGGSGGSKSDDDLFKYGDPAAGGIPPGSFVVAQNDTPGNEAPGLSGGGDAATPEGAAPAPAGDGGGGGVSSPAPAPGGFGSGGVIGTSPTPSPVPPVATPPASTTPPPPSDTPAPAPTQSGSTDPGTPISSPPPIPAVPEASNLAMMGLGALFLAVAATRRRRNG